jgi:hypothetical protein
MSGSNSGRTHGDGGGGGGGEEQFNCLTLVERTYLNSAVPAVVAALAVGSELEVSLRQQGDTDVLLALDASGAVAGSLTPSRLPRFLSCIREGVRYVAVIQEKDGGRIRVEIRPGVQ